jgi:ABC-2 type transport system ATP-binding protein
MGVLEVRDLRKTYGSHVAVNGVSFTVSPGDAFGLLGPNGAGKSTTIAMVSGLIQPDSGEVLLQGHSLRAHPRFVKQRLGLVPQHIALHERLTAEENLRYWGQVYGVHGARLRDNVEWCLRVAGLTDHRKQRVERFSGGMKRRLNIAVGLIHRPEVLIMDEPTVGIDAQSRNHILDTVRELNRDGMTVIYTSHYMQEVEYLCNRLAILDHGRMIAYGALDDVRLLAGGLSTVRMDLDGDPAPALDALQQAVPAERVEAGEGRISFHVRDPGPAVGKAVLALSQYGIAPLRIDIERPNLEAAFLQLTGRRLRDGGDA